MRILDAPLAVGINDAGQVVGGFNAFITGPNGVGMRALGTLGGTGSIAFDINEAGQVAGWSFTAGGAQHAFITGPDGMGMRDLGALGDANYSQAMDINNAGQVVGEYGTVDSRYGTLFHAFITGPDGMGMRDLGTLGGSGDMLVALMMPGRRWGTRLRLKASPMLSSPAQMEWA
jgi:probable HAF family extracellular repeat protein